MSLVEQLQEQMKQAMRARDQFRLSTLRMLLSSVSYARIEKGQELTDDDIMEVLAREAKRRLESAEAAEKGGRQEFAENERAEYEIIKAYLPKQLDETEVEAIVKTIIAEVGAVDLKDRGKVMAQLMPGVRGKADGKMVSQVVERILRG